MWRVPLFELDYGERERKAVEEVINSGWLTMGVNTKQFESEFSTYLGENVFSCAVSSGTAALHLSLLISNIQPGDEVIISGLSFIAALNVVKIVGATPILADSVSIIDWNIDPEDIKRKITSKSKAVIIVHYAGYPCDLDLIKGICKDNNLILIEDAAHAIGSSYKGAKCGSFGDISCFSFFSNKNLAVGEGGMLVTRSKQINEDATKMRSHGLTSSTIERHKGNSQFYDVIMPGLNYRIDEIRASLGMVQLSKLDKNNKKRKKLVERYIEKLKNHSDVVIPFRNISYHSNPSYHIFPILLKDKDRANARSFLEKRGIQTSIHYPSFNQFSFYRKYKMGKLPIANKVSREVITLPLYPNLKISNVDFICNSLLDYLKS